MATLACGAAVFFLDQLLLAHRSAHSLLGAAFLCFNIAVAGAVYFGLTVALRVPESMELLGFIQRKFGRHAKSL